MGNWKKDAIYNFQEFYQDITGKTRLDMLDDKDIEEYIDMFESAMFYEQQDNEDVDEFTLEEVTKFLKSVYI